MLYDYEKERKIKNLIIGGTIAATLAMGYAISQTAGCSRYLKTLHSSFDDGLIRVVYVYSMDGDLIAEYAGKFDVDYDSQRIIFDDENNKRHQIYYGAGSVVVDEITEDQLQELYEKNEHKEKDGVKVYTYIPSKEESKNL